MHFPKTLKTSPDTECMVLMQQVHLITKSVDSLAHSVVMTWSEIYCIDLAVNLIMPRTLLFGRFAQKQTCMFLLLDVCYTFQLHGSFLHCYGWSSYHSNKENQNGTMPQKKSRDVLHSACLPYS